ncbi:MAG TPA: class I SAM-dependent methyltransferase, partial [Rhodothermia bacterium]
SVSQNPGLVVEGRFAETLPSILENHRPFDLVFIDGHHDPAAAGTYLTMILPRLLPGAVVILDDVQPLVGAVRPAWRAIVRDSRASWSVDLIRMGVFGLKSEQ